MSPTLINGDHLIVNKLAFAQFSIPFLRFTDRNEPSRGNYVFSSPTRGDIVIFAPPDHVPHEYDLVKRVLGIPGDTVAINQDGVYINGEKRNEPYLSQPDFNSQYPSSISPSNVFQVGSGQYFVLGDNRDYSNDSRNWGTVPGVNITGKVWGTLPKWRGWDMPKEFFGD